MKSSIIYQPLLFRVHPYVYTLLPQSFQVTFLQIGSHLIGKILASTSRINNDSLNMDIFRRFNVPLIASCSCGSVCRILPFTSSRGPGRFASRSLRLSCSRARFSCCWRTCKDGATVESETHYTKAYYFLSTNSYGILC